MKKIVLQNGVYSGLLVALFMSISSYMMHKDGMDFSHGMYWGVGSQILALSFIFIGIIKYRKFNGDKISFLNAFKVGIMISLIASTFYVLSWEVIFNFFANDFMEHYAQFEIQQKELSGISGQALQDFKVELQHMTEQYQNPLVRLPYTLVEIFPTGLIMTLIASLVLRKK